MPSKRWNLRKHDRDAVNRLSAELNVIPLVAALLIARGYDTSDKAHTFLNPSPQHLHDPFLLMGMDAAVTRIEKSVREGEKILVWGDYDVDGTTGTVLLRKALKLLGAQTGYHVPNRFTEGYGINKPALQDAYDRGFRLVISVDTGTTSVSEVEFANSIGLDVIVTDHHLPKTGESLPPAIAIVNPNQPGCGYPDKHLAGVGVAFKLAHALLGRAGLEHEVPQFLKIAAIGTVADIMDLTGENRAIVALGLVDLQRTDNVGLRALMDVAECNSAMTSYHIGFRIGPRINAAGRMDVAKHVIELLECDDPNTAAGLARLLDSRNRERQQMQQRITELALNETESHYGKHFIVVAGEGWHRGVIGLAASRIAEKLYRPTIVLSLENGTGHGSARSIANFHLVNALSSCTELFEAFGGHAAAAGMTIRTDNIDALRRRLNEYASALLADEDLVPCLEIDALLTPQSLDLELVGHLAAFEPFGAGNPKPVFLTRGLALRDEPMVLKDKHLKFRLFSEADRAFEAVWWDGVERSKGQTFQRGSRIEIAYVPEVNHWQGNRSLQLVIEDLKVDN